MEISDDEVMVSFDVVSLFTVIPVNKACEYIRDKLNNDNTLHLSLNTDGISSVLELTLSNNYFVCNNCIYKQIYGCAMGSPVSPIVANLCMEVIEELAINTSSVPPKVWKRYVGDSFVIIKKDAVSSFHNTLNAYGKARETNQVRAALEANGYPSSVISTFLIKSHRHPQFPCQKSWSLCFLNGLSRLILTRVLHASPTSAP